MSFSLNRATIIGNITRDPESRTTTGGQNVVSFSIATSRRWKDQTSGELKEATEFHNLVAWGKLAQTIATYCHKGSKVYAEGRLQTRSWDDPTGVKKYRTEIVADSLILLDRKSDSPAPNVSTAAPTAPAAETPAATPSEEEINIEDIPF
ncbi:MAG: single-stranded DNA-binding protein [Candidatus Kerfeldbacteria bacterium]|nr:single-stranded DNA-binding protein [Candidatus Kerfeldbacteria bacterium]